MADFLITVQNNSVVKKRPSGTQLKDWAHQTLAFCAIQNAQLTLRLVDESESASLNQSYRQKTGPTNVLSFPYDHFTNAQASCLPDNGFVRERCLSAASLATETKSLAGKRPPPGIIGDIVICVPVVIQEAHAQEKSTAAHFAHMVVHGVLHILGYDHETAAEALIMEPLENKLLIQLGFKAPYGETISL